MSGGLLITWCDGKFVVRKSFEGEGYTGLCIEMEGTVFYIVNVYCPCSLSGKRKLWEELLALKISSEKGEWCVGGHFNCVTSKSERKGLSNIWRTAEMITIQFGSNVRHQTVGLSLLACVFKEMLKLLKEKLKTWNKEVFGVVDLNLESFVEELNELDVKACEGEVGGLESRRLEVDESFWKALRRKESILESKIKGVRPKLSGINFKELTDMRMSPLLDLSLKRKSRESFGVVRETKVQDRQAVTASFLALIPKVDHPQCLSEYSPISLIGCMHKVLAKTLANRLKAVLDRIISSNQTAFLPGRQLVDGVLVVNELIDWARKRKDKCLMLKVDIEKPYDSVSCEQKPNKRLQSGQGTSARRLFSSISISYWGRRLTGLVQKAVNLGLFKSYKINDGIEFNILQYADDTILIGEGTWENLWSFKTILRSIELVLGLKVNLFESKLYGWNLEEKFLEAASNFLYCNVDRAPFHFLGLPVGANPWRSETWKPVINEFKKKPATWKGRNLSIGGRVVLINSVLSSLPVFVFSFFKAPKKVQIQR
ncbi:cysteine-rich receptor-like protein kinase [Trifolium pratense]|uniref:Cysteine-rich receptor-like protein kinase n=1 Tax=Trifolium pratense TaxID=57577 RepID=A0A2K3P5L6_TRIPR|nr:cysteine-rich receptor-like protein kinase [Trifolium pratense]